MNRRRAALPGRDRGAGAERRSLPASAPDEQLMKTFIISFLIFLLLGAVGLAGLLQIVGRDLPSPAHLQAITPATKTRVLDRNGHLIGEFYRENRTLVGLEEIPESLVDAFIAVEDRRFWDHWGVDPAGIARASLKNMSSMSTRQGASTITQQLARNLFLTFDQTLSRKIKEAVLALRIEQNYSKREILEMYLNQIYFGDGAYGVQAAARRFFGKDVGDLTLAESSLLAGLPRNPRDYSPRRHPEAALRRRGIVLRSMVDCGYITEAAADSAGTDSLDVVAAPLPLDNAPYFMEMVRQHLESEYGSSAIYEGGLTVHTTLDLGLQQEAERELENHLTSLEKRLRLKNTRARYLAEREEGKSPPPDYLQGAALVLDAESGAMLALAGGRSFEESNFNRVTSAMRQPGSAFKPFIYLAAIQKGFYPSYTLMDAPVVYFERGQPPYRPLNYDREFRGPVTLRYALSKSLNVPTVKLQEEVGTAAVIQAARAAGIETPIPQFRSIALGSAEVTLEGITYAYAVFANNGIQVEPYFITKIEDRAGNVLREFRPVRREVLPAAPVGILDNMLETAMDEGTGAPARAMGFTRPAAGKSGTTDDYTDAWYVGFTPQVITGVWVGFDKHVTIGRGMTGSVAALPIWTKLMETASENLPPREFEMPEGVVTREICEETGLPASPFCPSTKREIFLERNVPSETCYLHTSTFDIDRRERWLDLRKRQDWSKEKEEERRIGNR